MAPHPCGCLTADRATDSAPDEAAVARELGDARARAWRCPCATGEDPPQSADELHPLAQEAVDRVSALTGARGMTTCPLWYARLPWVGEACRERKWAERGLLAQRVGEAAPAYMDAIDCIDASVNARMADDLRRAREKRDG